MEGYNFGIKLGTKYVLARTEESISIDAKIKESITKDDQGVTQRAVTGHDVSFTISYFILVDANNTTKLDRDDVMDLVLATGSTAALTIVYTADSMESYTGTGVITNYTENHNSSAEEDATGSLTIQLTSELEKVTSGGNG